MQGQYGQQNYVGDVSGQHDYTQAPNASSSMANSDPNALYQEQAPQMQYDPNGHAQAGYDQNYEMPSDTNGSAALDLYNNPYLSGQTAGAIDQTSQPVQAPYDPNAPQG